ncbi:phage N-6-adenine-methyltransferase [Escherichia coli]|nr:phage N-6-adenine-methyltransferase [Escherichia coli]
MSNKYCQELVELRNKPAHELKEVGDQWRTPDNIFWGINTLFGPFVLELFTDGDNAKCAAYYTAEDNALAHDWSERLAELKGAAFGNPPYSRASQHEGQYITGMRYIMKHASAMRDKGGRYVFLIKAATSEVWCRSVNAAVEHLRALEKKGVITIKRGVARGITLHTAVKDDDSEAVGIIRALLAGEENARLRATHWLHERDLKV